LALSSADSSLGDCWAPADSAVPQEGDSSPVDYSAVASSADSAVLTADDHSLPVAGLDGSPPADSAGYSLVLSADDSSPGDCLAPVDSAARMADDSAVRERPRPDARLEPADWPDGSPVGW
jgi:hypothetical protein